MRAVRRRIDPAWAAQAGREIAHAVRAMPEFGSACAVGLYRPLPGEVPVADIEAAARATGQTVLLPYWRAESERYAWAVWPPGGALVRGRYGVEEPADAVAASGVEPDLALVPGLAFDLGGRRLGQGGGHFDRLLAVGCCLRVGLAFGHQIVERVPTGPTDVGMHRIVTERGVFEPGRPGSAATSEIFTHSPYHTEQQEKKKWIHSSA